MRSKRPAESVTHEMIAERAYERFVQRGYEHGHHEEDWLAAEKDLCGESPAMPTETSRKTAPRPQAAARSTGTRANKTARRK